MKLRNKKTGEIISKIDVSQDLSGIWVMENEPRFYRTLTELNAEWEDYEPKEPLIKDEKIRKAVRAWADANCIADVDFEYVALKGSYFRECHGAEILFYEDVKLANRETYTIAELCGEEK